MNNATSIGLRLKRQRPILLSEMTVDGKNETITRGEGRQSLSYALVLTNDPRYVYIRLYRPHHSCICFIPERVVDWVVRLRGAFVLFHVSFLYFWSFCTIWPTFFFKYVTHFSFFASRMSSSLNLTASTNQVMRSGVGC